MIYKYFYHILNYFLIILAMIILTSCGEGKETSTLDNTTSPINLWTWMKGESTINSIGSYGTILQESNTNTPGAKQYSTGWTDKNGNFWIFGGQSSNNTQFYNDLWKFDTTTNNWTWMKGESVADQIGVYGQIRISESANTPGATFASTGSTGLDGNLWLFGGAYVETSDLYYYNDLWKFDTTTNNWTWMKGESVANQIGIYGQIRISESANTPGSRAYANMATDSNGNLWLFGGDGLDNSSTPGYLNDLWKFDTTTNNWTWMKGESVANQSGVYGQIGKPESTNNPGARYSANLWATPDGNLWLFGGYGYSNSSTYGSLNDLWKFDIQNGSWTWIKGESIINQPGIYGKTGSNNTPGARYSAISWTDKNGNLWLFSGYGYYDNTSTLVYLNDLWKFDIQNENWVWISGGYTGARYGEIETSNPNNIPGPRGMATTSSWPDLNGNLWLFGGYGYDDTGALGYLNDLWKYTP